MDSIRAISALSLVIRASLNKELKGSTWTFTLEASKSEDHELFIMFADLSNGKETYPPGRYLVAELDDDGNVNLDFNKAYNPPCAFTDYATCLFAPEQNRLAVPIEAGELYAGKTGLNENI